MKLANKWVGNIALAKKKKTSTDSQSRHSWMKLVTSEGFKPATFRTGI